MILMDTKEKPNETEALLARLKDAGGDKKLLVPPDISRLEKLGYL